MKVLGDVVKIDGGYAFKSKEFIANGTPIIRIGNIVDGNVKIDYSVGYETDGKNFEKYIISNNDILMAMSGATTGKLAMYKSIEAALLNQRVGRFKVIDETILNNNYLYYYLRSKYVQNEIISMASGCAQPNISPKQLLSIEIPIVPIEIQEKIVNILEKAEKALEKRKESINLLDELVKSKFIEMFGNPSINNMGWIEDRLATVVTKIENGKSFVCENFNRSDDYPAILKLSAVTYGIYNANENKALTDESLFVSDVEVKKGDLLFTRKNTPELVGMSAFVYDTEPNLMMPDLIFRFVTNDSINKIYLWKLINHSMFREKIKALSNGSAKSMSNISKQRLLELNIPIPPIELQNQFADFVKQVDKLKFEMEESLKELENNFNSLMQKAFKGELFN